MLFLVACKGVIPLLLGMNSEHTCYFVFDYMLCLCQSASVHNLNRPAMTLAVDLGRKATKQKKSKPQSDYIILIYQFILSSSNNIFDPILQMNTV